MIYMGRLLLVPKYDGIMFHGISWNTLFKDIINCALLVLLSLQQCAEWALSLTLNPLTLQHVLLPPSLLMFNIKQRFICVAA